MRFTVWLICLAGCGRIGFDTTATDAAASRDVAGATLLGGPLISVDPASLPAFGTPMVVSELVTAFEDDDPCLTRDGLELFFDSTRTDGGNDLHHTRRASITDPWGPVLPITELNTSTAEEHPSISGDGLTLYFTSGRAGNADLWMATRPDRDSPFGSITVFAGVNDPAEDQLGSVSTDGLSLMFSSYRLGGLTDDLYQSQRVSPGGAWSAPVSISELNTGSYDRGPHLDDFGLAVFFESQSELFWSSRPTIGTAWRAPIAIPELSSINDESDPWLSPDLRTIYFARNTGGLKHIYTATR